MSKADLFSHTGFPVAIRFKPVPQHRLSIWRRPSLFVLRLKRGGAMTAAERTFTVLFTESDLTKIVAALWREEHRQLFLSRMADTQGRSKEAEARRASAAAAQALSERLSVIGA